MCGQRSITTTKEVLFICMIFELDRWPTGKPETGYKDTDSRPTKMEVIASDHNSFEYKMTMEKRPSEELYDLDNDPEYVNNLSDNPKYKIIKEKMKIELFSELKGQGDPHMHGNGE